MERQPDHPSADIQAEMRERTEHARPLETQDHADYTEHTDHTAHARHGEEHSSHDKHAGHSPEAFRNRFWLSLVLSLPVIYYAEFFQEVFGYQAAQFPGSAWLSPVLGGEFKRSMQHSYGGVVWEGRRVGVRLRLAGRRCGRRDIRG